MVAFKWRLLERSCSISLLISSAVLIFIGLLLIIENSCRCGWCGCEQIALLFELVTPPVLCSDLGHSSVMLCLSLRCCDSYLSSDLPILRLVVGIYHSSLVADNYCVNPSLPPSFEAPRTSVEFLSMRLPIYNDFRGVHQVLQSGCSSTDGRCEAIKSLIFPMYPDFKIYLIYC